MIQPLFLSFIAMAPLLLLDSCGQIQIHDEVVYGLRGHGLGAVEVHTLVPVEISITQAQWDAISTGMLCESAETFGDWKEEIEKLCSYHAGECTELIQKKMQQIFDRIDNLDHDN